MNAFTEPPTDDEFEHLGTFLYGLHGTAMTIEEMGGFFCALICGPDLVPPSEYLPHVFGAELVQRHGISDIEEVAYIITLLNRHWSTMAGKLLRGRYTSHWSSPTKTASQWAMNGRLVLNMASICGGRVGED